MHKRARIPGLISCKIILSSFITLPFDNKEIWQVTQSWTTQISTTLNHNSDSRVHERASRAESQGCSKDVGTIQQRTILIEHQQLAQCQYSCHHRQIESMPIHVKTSRLLTAFNMRQTHLVTISAIRYQLRRYTVSRLYSSTQRITWSTLRSCWENHRTR